MKRNRWLVVGSAVLVLVLSLVMTACGSASGTNNESDDAKAVSESVVVSERSEDSEDTVQTESTTSENASDSSVLSFETTDLDGNPVKSEDVFGGNKITLVNIWGTFCPPCIREMPELEELSKRLTEKECGIIGVVCDISGTDDTGQISTAKDIISGTGVTYQNLLPWEGFDTQLPAEFIPTTYFVTADGQITGEPSVGAKSADDYEALADAVLEELGGGK